MYQTIYDVVEKRGRVKTGILLNGKDAGLKYLSEEGSFFYPEGAERNKEAEEFLKASVEAAVETGVVKNGDQEIFVETYEKNPRLIILGGGHVSLPVAEIGRMLGFHVTVMDDREEFVTEERFPMADERIFGEFDTLSDRIPPYENAYYVVVTRGHLGDSACARAILKRSFAYFGMIGSERRTERTQNMYQKIYDAVEKRGRIKTGILLNGEDAGLKYLAEESSFFYPEGAERNKEAEEFLKASVEAAVETGVVKNGDQEIFVETYEKNPRLIILGGGHVSLPVAEIGRMLGFHVTVMDDREEFVTEERFPMADERIFGEFDTLSDRIPPYENAYYVVVTRGHLGDSACARAILKRPFAYFGMIGSRTKVRITREKLLKEGFTEEQLDQIHAPIGLPIGGQMPAEIAVSIMAEIVQEKNRHFRTYCDEEVEAAVRRSTPGTMVTIIEKKGSSPRGTGSKMFVFQDGNTAGSIGGGKVEFEAGKHAVNIRNTETKVYELGQGAGDLGMICGGTVRVLFEPVNM